LKLPFVISNRPIQGNFDAVIKVEVPHYVGDADEPAFENSWQAYSGGGFGDPGFYFDRGRVWFTGLANRGAAPLTLTSLFTLPSSLWPTTSVDLSTYSSTGAAILSVSPVGSVFLAAGPLGPGGASSYVILEGLSYRPDVRA
jgi:hypothetical protein